MFYGPANGLSWLICHVHLKRMFILQLLGVVFYKCQLGEGNYSVTEIFCLFVLSVAERRLHCNCGFVSSFNYVTFSSNVFEPLLLGIYMYDSYVLINLSFLLF